MKNDTVRQAYTKILTLCDQKLMDIRTGQKVILTYQHFHRGYKLYH